MLQLAQLLPQKVLAKHQHDIIQLEVLLFGIAGFLKRLKTIISIY